MNMLDTTLFSVFDVVCNCLYYLFWSMSFMLITLFTLLTVGTVPFLPLLWQLLACFIKMFSFALSICIVLACIYVN